MDMDRIRKISEDLLSEEGGKDYSQMKCKTCKWWDDGACDLVGVHEDGDTKFDLEMSADDDQGLDGRLMVGPEFGCILHEPKVDSDEPEEEVL